MTLSKKVYFVEKNSIVRQIWGKSDTILFIFAGASAEFALNKAVDWLYFTNRLPADPIGRLFSTVSYAQTIVFSEKQTALRAIEAMATIHATVEAKRGTTIPDWAYRDVLFLLIDYSIRSFEVLERKLSWTEKNEVFQVFTNLGRHMGLKSLPQTFDEWVRMRQEHLEQNLQSSEYSKDLFRQYRKHLGSFRYAILLRVQALVVPQSVRDLLSFPKKSRTLTLITLYKISKVLRLDWFMKELLLPAKYKKQMKALDI